MIWAKSQDDVQKAVAFFLTNVSPAYISHGEAQSGRASDLDTWSPQASEVLRQEFSQALERKASTGFYLALAYEESAVCAVAFVEVSKGRNGTYATLHDIVIETAIRSSGFGAKALKWLESELKIVGVSQFFLESGVNNERAHQFFEREGFHICSKVMVKDLSDKAK